MRDRDFDSVADAFRDSLAYRASCTLVQRSTVAATESVGLDRLRGITRTFAAQSVHQRIQTIAMTIAIASLAHLAIRELLPRYATSGLPWWWDVAAAMFAVVIAMLAGPITSASADSTPARLWRRFIG